MSDHDDTALLTEAGDELDIVIGDLDQEIPVPRASGAEAVARTCHSVYCV